MVGNITSLTNNGLRDWYLQRVTALVIGGYSAFLFIYILLNPGVDFDTWQALFSSMWMKVFSSMVLVSIVLHAWIGLWTVITDYLKSTAVRGIATLAVLATVFALLFWGIFILWGI